MTATDTTVFSYSLVIRDMFLAKLKTAPFFAGFNFRKIGALPAQTSQLPYLAVYFTKEDMNPDGDLNHGDIDFIHDLTVSFSVVVVNNDPEACMEKLDQAYWVIVNTLWRDQYMMNMIDTRAYPSGIGNPDNVRIEGLGKGTRSFPPHPAVDNETPIGEMRYQQVVRYRAEYSPIITDDLLQIHQQTVPLATDGTIPPAEEVQRVITEHDLTPEEE